MSITSSTHFQWVVFASILALGQAQLMVPLSDESDWWSITRSQNETGVGDVQHRQISDTNLEMAGVDLRHITFAEVYKKLGKTPSVKRGDASTRREQACYVSPPAKRPAYLVFEKGEVNTSFYLFSKTTPWNGSSQCTRSDQISEVLKTASGLQLGQTPERVVEILGQPSKRQASELVYLLESKRKTDNDALDRARKQHPELSEEQFRDDYATSDITVFIRVKFERSKMVYLGVSSAETN